MTPRELDVRVWQRVLSRPGPPGPPPAPDEEHANGCVFDGRHGLDGGDCDCGLWDRILYWDGDGWNDRGVPCFSANIDDAWKVVEAMEVRGWGHKHLCHSEDGVAWTFMCRAALVAVGEHVIGVELPSGRHFARRRESP